MSRTYGEMINEALSIDNQEDADKFFIKEVKVMQDANPDWSPEKCASTVRSNLGYMAGYYSQEVSEHVKKFWGANHPIFGKPGYWGKVTPKEAFEKGQEMGSKP